jgi:O-antigen/teichoic acid export membrane protein
MSSDRSLKVVLNARAAVIRNVAGVVVSLATVPLALRALGTVGYGTFQVLVSLGNLAAMTDVGLGLALLTRVGQLVGAKQHQQIRHTIGGALMVIAIVVALVASLSIAALALIDVPSLLKVPPELRGQAMNGFYVVLAAFAVRMPLSAFTSAHGGFQIGDRVLAWNVSGTLLAPIAMVVAATTTRRLDVAIGAQLAVSLLATIGAVRRGFQIEPSSRPSFTLSDLASGWALLKSGFFYYMLQLEVTIISGLDNLVIAKVIGVEAVAVYSVASRVISLAFSMVYSLGASFWGGVSQAIGHGDIPWIRSEAARLRRVGALWMAVFAGGFAAVGTPVIALWTGNRIQVSPYLLVALGGYFALLGHTMIDASILNGAEKIRQQIVTVGMDAALNLGLSVWLAHRIGYVGVGVGTLAAYTLCTFVPLQYFSWKLVVGGERPPFWTRALTTMVLSVAAGFGISQLLPRVVGGRLPAIIAGGVASLVATLALTRVIAGREGIQTLVRTFRRAAP